MDQAGNQELTERFIQFYRNYCRKEIGRLAQEYPNERRSLYVDYNDLFTFDRDIAEDYLAKPDQMQEYAEEALRLYDLPADVSLGQAHVRLRNLPSEHTIDIRNLRVQDDHIGSMVSIQGIVRKATDVRPKVTEAAFECQRCGTMSYIPQADSGFQEPHECQGCERQGPFKVNHDQSEFVDSQKLRVQESPEGLRGGETPQSIDVDLEDDVTGNVTAGDHVTVTGVLHIEQVTQGQEKTALFDLYMDGVTIELEDEEFEDMDITDEDIAEIVELSNDPDIYEKMVGSVAPAIYGYEQEKLAMVLQLFSGVTKHLPDGSRIRGDLHLLLIGDPGTGKCLSGDTRVTLADGRERRIGGLVEDHLNDPKPVDDGVWDDVDFEVPSMQADGSIASQRATKVWKREAPDHLYRIRTTTGRELEITPSHPLFVPGVGGPSAVRGEELGEGQFVATPRAVPSEGDDTLDVKYRRSEWFVTERKSAVAESHAGTDGNTNTDLIPVGDGLRKLRETLGLTQAECGIPRSTYQHYERGDRNPSRDSLGTVVNAFERALPAGANEASAVTDGGLSVQQRVATLRSLVDGDIGWDRVESIETVEPEDDWVYDLEVEGTHNYLSNGVISHNSQMISYVEQIAPRSVYTSGKGSSAAGLTAAAVRDDFGDGQQWTLEAGALVLADKGIAAIDELDKMDAGDRSAMHEGLEQQQISISKAGINATLKCRCSLLGAANPKYGRFDQYEPIGEQIDLEPALISRFDLIFTVTDQPDPEHDKRLAEYILKTNYAGELNTQRENNPRSEFTAEEVENVTEEVAPEIDADLVRKYIAYAKRNVYPTMTDEAKAAIQEFYVNLRAKGADEDAPVPVTARKLEALVRLSEASARVRLSDTVEEEDADRVIKIVRECLENIGVDPETGEFDADVIETGTSKTQRDRIKSVKALIEDIEDEYDEGAPLEEVLDRAGEIGMDADKAEKEIENLRRKGELYEPVQGHLRTT